MMYKQNKRKKELKMNKEMIRKNNEIVRELKAQGYDVAWREEEKKTIIFIPGGATEHLKVVGYITKDNEVVIYEDKGIKELLEELEELEKESNRLEGLLFVNPYDEEIEKAFDEAYTKEWEVFNKLIDEVVKFTKGKIDRKQAYNMIQLKRDELRKIFEMYDDRKVKVLQNKDTKCIYVPYYRVNKDNGEMKAYIKNNIIDIELTEDRRNQCEKIEVNYIDIIGAIKDFPIVEKENACKSGDMFFENGLLITMYVYELSEQQMKENNLFYPIRCKVDSPLCKYGYRDYALCI